MKVLKQECYKLFIKREFLFLVILLVGLDIALTVLNLKAVIPLSQSSLLVYKEYIETYKGDVTNEKMQQIDSIRNETELIYQNKQELQEKYKNDLIGRKEYEEKLAEFNKYESKIEGINAFFNVADAAWLNGTQIMDNTGWNVLLNDSSIDIFLVIIIISLVVLLCIYDIENGFDYIKLSTANGKRVLLKSQLTLIISFSMFIGVFVSLGKYLIVDLVYGLDSYSFGLQNIEGFEETTKEISVLNAYILLSAIKTYGLLFLAIITFTIGVFLSSSLYTAFFSFVLTYLPAYILKDKRLLYFLPFPSAMLLGKGWFISLISEGETYFAEISTKEMSEYFVLMTLVIIILTIISVKHKLKGRMKQ